MSGYLLLDGTDDYAETLDKASLDLSTDVEAIVCVRSDVLITGVSSQALIGKHFGSAASNSYGFFIHSTAGDLRWAVHDGTSQLNYLSSVSLPDAGYSDGDDFWVRVTFDADDGGGNGVATFYHAADPISTAPASVSWTQLGTVQSFAFGGTIQQTNTNVTVGANANASEEFTGRIYVAHLYDGIGGTLVADPDFRDDTQGWSSPPGTDGQSNSWTLNGDATWVPPEGRHVGRHVHYDFANKQVVVESGV